MSTENQPAPRLRAGQSILRYVDEHPTAKCKEIAANFGKEEGAVHKTLIRNGYQRVWKKTRAYDAYR